MRAHEHTTAHIVSTAAAALGLSDRLRLHQVGGGAVQLGSRVGSKPVLKPGSQRSHPRCMINHFQIGRFRYIASRAKR